MLVFVWSGVDDEANDVTLGMMTGYKDRLGPCMTCTSYARVSGKSGYWTWMIGAEGFMRSFGGLEKLSPGFHEENRRSN